MTAIQSKVIEIIAHKVGKPSEAITLEMRFVEDLGLDSLDYAELSMDFEEKFNITIPEDQEIAVNTVGELIEYLEQRNAK